MKKIYADLFKELPEALKCERRLLQAIQGSPAMRKIFAEQKRLQETMAAVYPAIAKIDSKALACLVSDRAPLTIPSYKPNTPTPPPYGRDGVKRKIGF